jgi:hypothetical protein
MPGDALQMLWRPWRPLVTPLRPMMSDHPTGFRNLLKLGYTAFEDVVALA